MTNSLAARSLLITGVAGLVGRETADRAARAGFAPIWGTWHNQEPEPLAGVQFVRMDITDRAATDALVRDLRPRAIIHTAYRKTGPNAQAVNADGAGNVAAAAARADARMVHISSDMVLDGDHAPYDERGPQPGAGLWPQQGRRREAGPPRGAGQRHRAYLPGLPAESARSRQRMDTGRAAKPQADHPFHRRDTLRHLAA